MRATQGATCLAAVLFLAVGGAAAEGIVDQLAKPSLNVVITVSDMEAAKTFYGEVLGLTPMAPIRFSERTAEVFFPEAVTMERYRVGTQEIKLIPGVATTEKHEGGIDTGIGLRMVNYPIPDVEAFKKRLEAHGYEMPAIGELPGSTYRFGLLDDPDGNVVEFYYYDGEGPEGWENTIHLALTVSDAEASRKFYGDVLGMTAMPTITMPGRPETMVHLFRAGTTLVKFWSFGDALPNRAGRHLTAYGNRYLQYHVRDIDAAYEYVSSRGATIDLPPTAVGSMPVEIMFVADPDGIINEVFGVKLGNN